MQGLRRRFGSAEAVAGVDLRVAAGETVALLGPNGAGKSTTLAMILGLLPATAGQVTIDGRTPRQALADGLVGALLQSGAGSGLPSGTRVGELIGFVASLYPARLAPPAVLRHAGLASLAGHRVDRCPAASGSGSGSRWPSALTRGCSSSTSRPQVSTFRPGGPSGRRCGPSPPRAARCCSRPTT
jgi:ABC-type transporter Mla maintaining outer membrane lipid asymmetry ATPase subunit MlaF